jgi:hypothetical protein
MSIWWLPFVASWGVLSAALALDISRNFKSPRPWYVFVVWPPLLALGFWRMDATGVPLSGSLKLFSLVAVVVLVVTLGRPTRMFDGEDFDPAASASEEAAHGATSESKDKAPGGARRERITSRTQLLFLFIGGAIIATVYFGFPGFLGIPE